MDIKGSIDKDIQRRINLEQGAFNAPQKIRNSTNIGRRRKLIVLRSNVKSVLIYGSEIWKYNKNRYKKLYSFVNFAYL